MKINLILPAAGHSGGVQMATDYLNYFSQQGNDVICYVPFTGAYYGWKKVLFLKAIFRLIKSKDLQGKWISSHITIKFVPYISNAYIRNADITIATSWLTSYWVEKLGAEKGAKVYFIQGFETWGNQKENIKVRESYSLPYDLRVSVSTELHDRLLNELNIDSEVVCNGIPEVNISKKHRQSLGKDVTIGIPFREKRSVADIKNVQFGISSLEEFKKNNLNIKLKTFGFRRPNNFPANIEFLENPSRDKLNNWYDSVDIFYVPSLYEGWGLPAMEAMARGCVVIGADTGCLKEFGQHLENCYKLTDMKNRKELFNGLQILIQDSDLRNRIAKNAVDVVNNYSFEKEAQQFLNLLKNYMQRK